MIVGLVMGQNFVGVSGGFVCVGKGCGGVGVGYGGFGARVWSFRVS
jgi:hypothetical protein